MSTHEVSQPLPGGGGEDRPLRKVDDAFAHVDRVMVGLITFLASEIMLFGAFFTAFFYIRYKNYEVFPPEGFDIPVSLTGINTAILVSSSFTMHWALVSVKRGNRSGLTLGLLFTLLLGLTFLGIQVNEYRTLGWTPETGAFGSVFFSLTGLHGSHVFIGALLLAIALTRSLRGHFSPAKHMGVELTGLYWHFVDLVWVVLYTTVYLLANGERV
jgi:cytochrome c oxidase subunit 3